MALRALMIAKKLSDKRKALDELNAKFEEFAKREAELEQAINEVSTDEEEATVAEAVSQFEKEKEEAEKAKADLEAEVEKLESDLKTEEESQELPEGDTKSVDLDTDAEPSVQERGVKNIMTKRNLFSKMNIQERNAFINDEGMQAFLKETRSAIAEKRAIQNVGLTIPEVVLPLLRENIERWSKLYGRVNVRYISGEGHQIVAGDYAEAVWTECCAKLNELALGFNEWTVDCYKVGGFYAICNANLEDSDLDLAEEIINALGVAIGKAIDKAITHGRNTNTNMRMPLGVVTSLLEEAQPAYWPTNARPWQDLHTSHVITIAAGTTGAALFEKLTEASAVASSNYSRGQLTWLMNDKTYKDLVAKSISVNASGAIVAGVNGTMPIVGGDIVVLNYLPDNQIVFGYFDLYLLAERAGRKFASSEHVKFIEDMTVFKGTARYDGAPLIREAFGIVALNGATVAATDVTFPQDTANDSEGA